MGAKANLGTLIMWFATVGVGASSVVADHLPTHGLVLHLDSGEVPIGISPMAFTAFGNDDLDAPPHDYHWEIHISNVGGLGNETFTMAVNVKTPAGPVVTLDAGTATIPPFSGLYWDYHLPDPFGEIAPLAVRTTYTKPRIGLVPLAFQTTITEYSHEPTIDQTPQPPAWVRPGSGYGAALEGAFSTDVVFTLTLPGLPGDYNGNGVVDGADYVLWRDGGPLQNEVDTPGTVDAADYTAWRARFGNMSGSGSGLGGVVVPEPASGLLLLFGAVAAGRRQNRIAT